MLTVLCIRDLDAIAISKLVQFVNALMEKYFDFVQQRIQQEVGDIVCSSWSLVCHHSC